MRMDVPARRTRVCILIVLTMAVAFATPAAASAQLGSFRDAKDTGSRLDLAHVSLRFHARLHRYTWRFSTFQRFRLANGGTFVLFIDSVGAGRWDYRLYVWDDPGSSGVFCDRGTRPGAGSGSHLTPLAWDVAPRSGWCSFRGIRHTKPVRWRVITVRHQGKPFGPAVDRAPDSGWF